MNQLHEIINYNEKLPVRLFVHHQGSFPVHWHSSIEIQMLLSGSSKVTASGIASELKEGDLILLNGNELHDISSEGCVALVLQFRADLFDERYVRQGLHFSCNSSVSSEPWRYKPLKVILANMVKLNADGNEGNELLTLSLLYQLMHLLIEGFRTQGSPSMVSIDKKNRNRMKGIVDYLEENFMEPLSLQTIAAREFLSPTYFSSFFEHNMGVTFSSYLTALRLNHALNDLMYTSFTLEEIASRNGFPSSRAMSSAFKARFGILPSHYRTAHSNSARLPPSGQEEGYVLLAREDFLNSLAEYLDTPDVPAGKSKSICMNYSVQEVNSGTITARLRHTFKVMTTVGKARDLLDSNIRRMLEELQKEVGFTHIKFHGLLDDSMHLYNEDENGNIRFVYSYIDEVFDYLLGIGLKPMIQLSFMPSKLAERPDAAVFESHFIISPPKDLEKWKTLVSSLTLHLIKRYGMSEVSSWLFTFWNEPISVTPFTLPCTVERVHEIYRSTRDCLKEISTDLRFAGPSFISLERPEGSFERFMDLCEETDSLPDMFLLHHYPVVEKARPGMKDMSSPAALSKDPAFMRHSLNGTLDILSKYPEMPVYITEWSSTTSHRDYLNDTCFKSAYIVKNLLDNYDSAESFAYWCLTDLIEELKPEPELFHGGLGLFTRNGIRKPGYYALSFLSKLGDELVSKGENHIITRNSRGETVVLLHNYCHYSDLYSRGINFNVSFTQRYNAFVNALPLRVSIPVTGLDNGSCRQFETWVNRSSGSCFDKWLEMGMPEMETTGDAKALAALSYPMQHTRDLEITENRWILEAELEPHEIRLVILGRSNLI